LVLEGDSMRLLDAKEVAEILQVNTQRVYELTRQGILPSIRLGAREIRFEEERLLRWIENGGRLDTINPEDQKSDSDKVDASNQRVAGKSQLKNADTRHQKDRGGSALLLDELRGFEPIHFTLECTLRVT
jgi:excisionase family DNA binding protein